MLCAGTDAPPYQSGLFNVTKRHISKRGSAILRKVGYEIMRSFRLTKSMKNKVYDYILKKENKGKAKKVAHIAGLNKFFRIYYAIVSQFLSYFIFNKIGY